MGLITWIKDKYNNHKFQKATQVLSEGKVDEAVEIFKEILDSHPDAPYSLLSIYHSLILKGNKDSVSNVASLYENHKHLKDKCIDFAKQLESTNQIYLHIDYCQALYCKGISELLNSFVNSATKLVVSENYISNLESLTKNTFLLQSLSDSILINAQKRYVKEKNLSECERLCLLIKPYLSSKTFYEFYSKVRFDLIIQKNITEESIKQIDTLFRDIKTVYRLSNTTLKSFIEKNSIFAKDSFEKKDYISALLISRRIAKDNLSARKIYADSALKLYSSSSSKSYLIESDFLYKCLGDTDSILINSLEPFIPYATHREKYISVAVSELSKLVTIGEQKQAENVLDKAWSLTPDKSIIKAVLTNGSNTCRTQFATLIANDYKRFLSNSPCIDIYVTQLSKFDNIEFIVATLETLLYKGKTIRKSIVSNYESQILRLANNQKEKSRKRIEIIERGLTNIQTDRLYTANADNLNDYIYSGHYDSKFAAKIAASLIGYNDLAEPLLAKILVDEAKKGKDDITCEQKLRKALSINNTHNKLFNITAYNAVLTEIREQIIHLAKELYVSQQPRAIELLYLLRDNNLSWYNTYAVLYLDSIQNQENSEEIASKVFAIIKEGYEISSSFNDVLWDKYVSVKSFIICKKNIDEAIAELASFLSEFNSLCNSDNKESLSKEISSSLRKRLLSRGKEYEKNHVYDKAIDDYTSILSISGNFFYIRARISICKLKNNKSLSSKETDEINNLLRKRIRDC